MPGTGNHDKPLADDHKGRHGKGHFTVWKSGAGEGIRTLDFNLGKVALYP